MKFTTQVEIPEQKFLIDYATPTLIVGSCFAQNIGAKLAQMHLPVDINPCGVAFNPVSIANTFDLITERLAVSEQSILQNGELWCSLYHSTLFSATERNGLLDNIESRLAPAKALFKEAKYLIITLGTAWVYRHKASNIIVNNCHKLPEHNFVRELLSVEQCVEILSRVFLQSDFSNKQIILTVSPVRHVKDTLHGNNISKSTLLLAVDKLVQNMPNVHYFPAYEIVVDELRDYRFYAEDLVHPSQMAVDYIWEKFSTWAFDKATLQIAAELNKIDSAMAHRPVNPNSEQHRIFRQQMLDKVVNLQKKYPHINLKLQRNFFNENI